MRTTTPAPMMMKRFGPAEGAAGGAGGLTAAGVEIMDGFPWLGAGGVETAVAVELADID